MTAGRLAMNKLRQTLQLKYETKLSNRQIGGALGISASTVSYYTRAFTLAGLSWPLIPSLTDAELSRALEPYCHQLKLSPPKKVEPDYSAISKALRNKCVTREYLYEQYQQRYGKQAYSYAEYCRRYRTFMKTAEPTLRQNHVAGEKIFVDYAGVKLFVTDPSTNTRRAVNIFVGVLGASNYTFVDATFSRSSEDWLGSHTRMVEFFGGVPTLIIPDNEKSAVTRASRDCAQLNANMAAWANHYNTTILPARPGKPKDKAKVEKAVQCVERQILVRLQSRTFYSLEQLNDAIKPLLKSLNDKPFQKISGSRTLWYEDVDMPALKPLPDEAYPISAMYPQTVALDYHVRVDNHHYSVPHQYVRQQVYIRKTAALVEVFLHGERIAAHPVSQVAEGKTTCSDHMPSVHRNYNNFTPKTFLDWMIGLDDSVAELAQQIIKNQTHPECCYRIYIGMRRLVREYGDKRFIKACQRAWQYRIVHFKSIESILKNCLDAVSTLPAKNDEAAFVAAEHAGIRGADYYVSLTKEKQNESN